MEMGLWESLDNSILPAHSSYYKVSKSRDILYLFYIYSLQFQQQQSPIDATRKKEDESIRQRYLLLFAVKNIVVVTRIENFICKHVYVHV